MLFCLIIFLGLFYVLQKFIVYGQDGVYLDFTGESTTVVQPGSPGTVPLSVKAEIVFDEPDYSDIDTTAGQELESVKALYLTADKVNAEALGDIRGTMDAMGANALVLEMKTTQGVLSWNSSVQLAASYGVNGTADLTESIAFLKEQGVYLIARISVCVDEYMAMRNTPLALATTDGRVFKDDSGFWLDPSHADVQKYTAELIKNLIGMGFDEVMLADFQHPSLTGETQLAYSQLSSIILTPRIILSGFALSMREAAEQAGGKLSVYCNAHSFRNGLTEQTGQDPVAFGKAFDRLYWTTDRNAIASDMETVSQAVPRTSLATRFVPIMYGGADTESWMSPVG